MVNSGKAEDRRRAGRAATALWTLWRVAEFFVAWILEKFPILGHESRRRRHAIVLQPYVQPPSLIFSLLTLAVILFLPFALLVYGFMFGLSVPFVIVPFAIPIAVIGALIIWSLPDMRTAPTLGLEMLLPTFLVVQFLWPGYLAIALPGLPWITLTRLAGFPMAALLLVCLSVSERFRNYVGVSVTAIRPLAIFLMCFVAVEILTIPFSSRPIASAQLVFTHQVNWTTIFVLGCIIFRDIRYVERYFALFAFITIAVVGITYLESFRRHAPWAAHIPGFLKVPDDVIELVLKPNIRLFLNRYRAKATFFTPLALSEFLSLMTPFFLYFVFARVRFIWRVGAAAMIPALFVAVRMTDSRLGLVGMLLSVVLYGFLWSIVRWRARKTDLFAAVVLYGYPTLAALFLAGVFGSGRLRVMILGGQAQASSGEMRETQLSMAIAALARQPVGYGSGQSGPSLGFAPGSFISVDNYFITVAMDYGPIGAFLWYGMFLIAILEGVKCCLSSETAGTREALMLAPLVVTLSSFLVLKWVHGQDSNHALYFLMLGMISALVYRLRNSPREPAAAA